jgi:glycosyltransferase involved in cell wall biosynthesis
VSEAAPPISIVVPTRDRPEMLERCLATVMASRRPDDDVLVVDSASTDSASVRSVAEAVGARLVRCDRKGAAHARNTGWRAATHDLIAYTDDDVWLDEGWATAYAAASLAHPSVAFFTGRIEVPPHQVPVDRPVSLKEDAEPHTIDLATTGILGHGASVAVRREALERVGGFDEQLGAGARFPGAEEVDLFDRLLTAGMIGRYEPTALAWHDQWRDRNALVRLDYRYGVGDGARLAKLARTNRRRARSVAGAVVWDVGLREAWFALRHGWQYGALMRVANLAGVVVGAVQASAYGLDEGHLRPRRRSARTS